METGDRDIMRELADLVSSQLAFSDILFEPRAHVMIKMPRGWEVAPGILPLDEYDIEVLLDAIDPDWRNNITKHAINRPLEMFDWRLRINAYLAFSGSKVMLSIRRVPINPPSLKNTGLPAGVRLLIESLRGIILVTGPTGSGKSTSMAAMVDAINETRHAHIITIEDPIEYIFTTKKSIFSQREVGVDVATFYDGVRDSLRQRPDVILIGEIRDRETAETALLAGESGHLVIGTMHANSAPGAVQKILSFFGAHERESKLQSLAGSLVGILHQMLLPRADGKGYALAAELLANNKQQYSRILGDPDKLQAMIDRKEDGISRTMTDSLIDLVNTGQISKTDAIRSAPATLAMYDKLK